MANAGQTCENCNGTCCERTIAYQRPPKYPHLRVMKHSHAWLISHGFVEITTVSDGNCPALTADRRCAVHRGGTVHGDFIPRKPLLCRSWWCHGKLWQPRQDTGIQFWEPQNMGMIYAAANS